MENQKLPRVLPREVPNYHERQAAHLRALADTTTTGRIKARLIREAEEHEWLAQEEETLSAQD